MDRGKAENGDDLIHSEPETVIQPTPAPISSSTAPPPFLIKTYDMVDDPSTDAVISWSSSNNSFVVWNPPELGDLLPKYFKHSNFSSFVRQLNTYGFRKVDPDRWEFAHEGFLRDQKHLLKKIRRRRPLHGHSQPHTQQPQSANSACVEVGKFGLEREVGRLKRDKNVLMQELVRLRQQQQSTDHQLQTTVQRLQGMEQRQQQIMSFLAKVVHSPGFLVQFVKQQSESKGIPEGNKRRRVKSEHKCGASSSDGQIVKYQSYPNETEKAMFRQLWDMNGYLRSESFNNKHDSVPVSGVRSSNMPDKGTSSSPTSGSVLQDSLTNSEKPATLEATDCKTTAGVGKDQSSSVGIVSEVTSHQQSQNLDALFVTHEAPQVSRSQSDAIMDEFPLYPDMTCQSIADSSNNKLLFGPTSFEEDGEFPLDIDNISLDPDIEAFFNEDEELLDMLNEKSEGIHTTTDGATPSKNSLPAQAGQLDSLTEQMGLPPSDPKKTI